MYAPRGGHWHATSVRNLMAHGWLDRRRSGPFDPASSPPSAVARSWGLSCWRQAHAKARPTQRPRSCALTECRRAALPHRGPSQALSMTGVSRRRGAASAPAVGRRSPVDGSVRPPGGVPGDRREGLLVCGRDRRPQKRPGGEGNQRQPFPLPCAGSRAGEPFLVQREAWR
jgi:hypothetical protein